MMLPQEPWNVISDIINYPLFGIVGAAIAGISAVAGATKKGRDGIRWCWNSVVKPVWGYVTVPLQMPQVLRDLEDMKVHTTSSDEISQLKTDLKEQQEMDLKNLSQEFKVGFETLTGVVTDASKVMKDQTEEIRSAVKRIEARQDISDAEARILKDADGTLCFRADANGKICWVSKKMYELIDALPQEFMRDGWISFVHPGDKDGVVREWEDSISQSRQFLRTYRVVNKASSAEITVKASAEPVEGHGDETLGYVGIWKIIEDGE